MSEFNTLWEVSGTKGADARIALLDTGVDITHPEFRESRIITADFCNPSGRGLDIDGHGTHCAGALLQVAPACTLLSGRILTKSGMFTYDALLDGLYWASTNAADLVCICTGERFGDDDVEKMIAEITGRNCQVIAAIGNNGGTGKNAGIFPARYPQVIAAGSIDEQGQLSVYTDVPDEVDIFCLPGEDFTGPWLNHQEACLSGTSVSAALLTGVLALLISQRRKNNLRVEPGLLKKMVLQTSLKKKSARGIYYVLEPSRLFE